MIELDLFSRSYFQYLSPYFLAFQTLVGLALIIPEKGHFVERIIDTEDDDLAGTNNPNPYLFTGRRLDILDGGSLKLQYNRNRYYDTYTGRWLTKDPLGIDPAAMAGKIRPAAQYKDGMNLYEYVKSNPIGKLDAFGLWSNTSERVCCKLERRGFFGLGSKSCRQAQLSNRRGLGPMEKCKCVYEKGAYSGKKWKVTSAASGKCKWCTVRFWLRRSTFFPETGLGGIVIDPSAVLNTIAMHATATIKCNDGYEKDFTVSHFPGDDKASVHPTYGNDVCPGRSVYKCRTSQKKAQIVYAKLASSAKGWLKSGTCWGPSVSAVFKLCKCPY